MFSDEKFAIHVGRVSEDIVNPNSETFVGPVEFSPLPTLKLPQERSLRSEEPKPSTTNPELLCPTSAKRELKNPRAGKSALITSSPFRQQLTVSLNIKLKQQNATKKKLFTEPLKTKVIKSKPRKQSPSSSRDEESEGNMVMIDSSESGVAEDYDAECLFCTGLLSEDRRG
ncbi:hypothetical protein PR048_014324 [Dryococelus australis]|uniref:Uncharacterized protein n=1 Tax=Dryococelus australis TaxID=614101 RepID=A0ABQ9HDX7_9NEOP|nr:hypothetical protein PR048_014324 [Dryococelus australis]